LTVDKFAKAYLFKGKTVYRWQGGKKGKCRHLGRGIRIMPVFAYFFTKQFKGFGKR